MNSLKINKIRYIATPPAGNEDLQKIFDVMKSTSEQKIDKGLEMNVKKTNNDGH